MVQAESTTISNTDNVSWLLHLPTSKLTLCVALEVSETGSKGQGHGRIHLDRWLERCAFKDKGLQASNPSLRPFPKARSQTFSCGGVQLMIHLGWRLSCIPTSYTASTCSTSDSLCVNPGHFLSCRLANYSLHRRLCQDPSRATKNCRNGISMAHRRVKLQGTTPMSTYAPVPSFLIPSVAAITFSFCAKPGIPMEAPTSSITVMKPRD